VPHQRMASKGQRFHLFLLAGFGLTLLAPALFGDPCGQATVATYRAAGFQCTIDGYVLEDLTFSDSETGAATLLSDSEIVLTPSIVPDGISFQFCPFPASFSILPLAKPRSTSFNTNWIRCRLK